MQITQDSIHHYVGMRGYASHCWLRVYMPDQEDILSGRGVVVLVTQCRDNHGTSVTNWTEELATEVWDMLGRPSTFTWIESHEDSFLGEESVEVLAGWFNRLEFDTTPWSNGSRFAGPTWVRLTRSEVESFTGYPLTAPLRV